MGCRTAEACDGVAAHCACESHTRAAICAASAREASAGRRRWDGGRCQVVTPWQGGHGGDPCVIGWTDSWGSAGGLTLGPVAGGWEWRGTLLSPAGVCLGWNDVKLLKYTC